MAEKEKKPRKRKTVRVRLKRDADLRLRSSARTIDLQIEDGAFSEDVTVPLERSLIETVFDFQNKAVVEVHRTLGVLTKDLGRLTTAPRQMPPKLVGRIVNRNGGAAAGVQVTMPEPDFGDENVAWPAPQAVTNHRGVFSLTLPPAPMPKSQISLLVKGSQLQASLTVARVDVEKGSVGDLYLDVNLRAADNSSLLETFISRIPSSEEDVDENPDEFTTPAPQLTLGEGDCARAFRSHQGVVDRFRYGLLVRLVEPQIGAFELSARIQRDRKTTYVPNPLNKLIGGGAFTLDEILQHFQTLGDFQLRQRSAVDEPIFVSGFRDDVSNEPLQVPKAATLGLGYLMNFRQTWVPTGLSLGDLVYSLALAPGEQQRLAVFEKEESLQVVDTERVAFNEVRRFQELAETSTETLFESALSQSVAGGSEIDATSHVWGVGVGGFIGGFAKVLFGVGAAAGYGGANTSGDSASWQKVSRDFASSATQEFHSNLSRGAAARRSASRTGMRLASATDSDQVTTKVLTNYNHSHALTVQFWEVLRHFDVRSVLDDVELVCYVPLELIPFKSPDEKADLLKENLTRDRLVNSRYAALLRHLDVVEDRLRRHPNYREGLELLRQLAADPTMEVEPADGPAENLIDFSITGTFLPFEEVSVTVVSKRGEVVGPFALKSPDSNSPVDEVDFAGSVSFIEKLRDFRTGESGITLTASIPLPLQIPRNEVVRFDVRRRFRRLSVAVNLGINFDEVDPADLSSLLPIMRLRLSPRQLEQIFGGPFAWDVKASLSAVHDYLDAIKGRESAVRLSRRTPLASRRLPPLLRYTELLRIESVYQHVVHNTVSYSKAVWAALSPEERVLLLERFTIGIPTDGSDVSVPLLNCVANRVVGFFGNSMVMPFFIPPPLAEELKVTTRDLQEALLRFHRQSFSPPRTSLTLPTQGVLGEAVLGGCNASEKIDLTRFWNWKDSPLLPDGDSGVQPFGKFRSPDLAGDNGAAGPSKLAPFAAPTTVVGSITNAAPKPDESILKALLAKGVAAPTLPEDLVGLTTATALSQATLGKADLARSQALSAAQELANKSIDAFPDALKASEGLDDASVKAAEEAKTKEKEQQAAAKTKEEEQQAAAKAESKTKAEALTKDAQSVAASVGASGDQTQAQSKANQIAEDVNPDNLDLATKSALFAALTIDAASDSQEIALGKFALLKAFGFDVPAEPPDVTTAAGVAKLKASPLDFVALVGGSGDQSTAEAKAQEVVTALLGASPPTGLSVSDRAALASAFSFADSDSDAVLLGKWAMLKALGIDTTENPPKKSESGTSGESG